MITFRQPIDSDLPGLAEILQATGATPDSLRNWLRDGHAGWVCCADDTLIGVSMADRRTGELWAVAVIPEHRGKGIGRELARQAEAWLFSHGWEEIRHHPQESGIGSATGFGHRLGWMAGNLDGPILKKANPGAIFALEEHSVTDPDTGYTRLIRLQRGPGDLPHQLCLFLDGEHYWRDLEVLPILKNLSGQGGLPPMTFAFVGHVSGAARQEDYLCNERYARFIGGKIVPWLRDAVPSIRPDGHVIAGLSLSGLMASHLKLRYPSYFSACLSQSGSHWWNHEWFAGLIQEQARIAGRFWLSVGDEETQTRVTHSPGLFQEISQIEGVEKIARILGENGATVHPHRFQGGHSRSGWREELGDALRWLVRDQ